MKQAKVTNLAGRLTIHASKHLSADCSWPSLVGSDGGARDEVMACVTSGTASRRLWSI